MLFKALGPRDDLGFEQNHAVMRDISVQSFSVRYTIHLPIP